MKNTLFFGDNLNFLRQRVDDESVDLIYLDPPFNSDANYNVLFGEQDGSRSAAQIQAFEDTWQWDESALAAYTEVVERGGQASLAMQAFHTVLRPSNMLAYLAMMSPRLIELKRVLKPTGSIYLHCDPTASHYLKLLMDSIFEPGNFVSEIAWKRTSAHSNASHSFGGVHDVILFYKKGRGFTWNQQYSPYSEAYIAEHFVHKDSDGRLFRRADLRNPGYRPNLIYDYTASNGRTYKPHRNGWAVSLVVMKELDRQCRLFFPAKVDGRLRKKIYLDESPGVPLTDIWDDLPPIHASSQERLGYQTQKPEALLERIIKASSNEGDVVLDPFCGCGTAVAAAQKLNRRWIGIDITYLAISLIKNRLKAAFGDSVTGTYEEIGEPVDLEGARALAESNPYQFQWWALDRVNARPSEQKKGADKGVDGRIFFHDEAESGNTKQIVISVKSGKLHATYVRDLVGVVNREKAAIGVLISMDEPTKPMRTEALAAGYYESPWDSCKYPRLQLLTIEQLLAGESIKAPVTRDLRTFKKVPKAKPKSTHRQQSLLEDE